MTSKKLILFSLTLVSLFSATACNTISGVGKDISSAGNAIEKAAEKNKKKK